MAALKNLTEQIDVGRIVPQLPDLVPKYVEEVKSQALAEGSTEVGAKHLIVVDELKAKLQTAEKEHLEVLNKLKARLERMERETMRSKLITPILFIFFLVCAMAISALALFYLNAKATVTIQYNVGEIIGAILGGTGAAAAGLAYAAKTLRSSEEERGEENET